MKSLRSDGMITISRFDVTKPETIETYRFEISIKNKVLDNIRYLIRYLDLNEIHYKPPVLCFSISCLLASSKMMVVIISSV